MPFSPRARRRLPLRHSRALALISVWASASIITAADDPPRGDAVLRKLGSTATVELSIVNPPSRDGPDWRRLDAVVTQGGASELRVTDRARTAPVRKFPLDEAARAGLLQTALAGLGDFQLETRFFEDGSALDFKLSAGTSSVAVQLPRTVHFAPAEAVACYLNGKLPADQQLAIGVHSPALHESQLQEDRLLLRRHERPLATGALQSWDVSIRAVSPADKVLTAMLNRSGMAVIGDEAAERAAGPRRKDASQRRTELRDLTLKCIREYALVVPRERLAGAAGKTAKCRLSLTVYDQVRGTAYQTASLQIEERDFEWNKTFYDNVQALLKVLTEIVYAAPP